MSSHKRETFIMLPDEEAARLFSLFEKTNRSQEEEQECVALLLEALARTTPGDYQPVLDMAPAYMTKSYDFWSRLVAKSEMHLFIVPKEHVTQQLCVLAWQTMLKNIRESDWDYAFDTAFWWREAVIATWNNQKELEADFDFGLGVIDLQVLLLSIIPKCFVTEEMASDAFAVDKRAVLFMPSQHQTEERILRAIEEYDNIFNYIEEEKRTLRVLDAMRSSFAWLSDGDEDEILEGLIECFEKMDKSRVRQLLKEAANEARRHGEEATDAICFDSVAESLEFHRLETAEIHFLTDALKKNHSAKKFFKEYCA